MNKVILMAFISFILYVPPVFADSGELMLDKLKMDYNLGIGDSACGAILYIESGKDVPNLADEDYSCYYSAGRYTMVLYGPAGSTVTLFGKESFKKERGYLVIKKKDDKLVWILDLEDFPHRQWFYSAAVRKSGAYEAFYDSAPIFEQNVSSIKWGRWWSGEQPPE